MQAMVRSQRMVTAAGTQGQRASRRLHPGTCVWVETTAGQICHANNGRPITLRLSRCALHLSCCCQWRRCDHRARRCTQPAPLPPPMLYKPAVGSPTGHDTEEAEQQKSSVLRALRCLPPAARAAPATELHAYTARHLHSIAHVQSSEARPGPRVRGQGRAVGGWPAAA